MDLDHHNDFHKLDPHGMLTAIDGLPNQLLSAWELGQKQTLSLKPGIQRILIAGMGGSAIGADLLAAYVASACPLPIFVHRDYGLPAWARGGETLVITCSHSGDTEETLSSFESARQNGCQILALTTGGKLAQMSKDAGCDTWSFVHHGQPRAAVGFSFGLLLALFHRLGLIPDPAAELQGAVEAMLHQQAGLRADVTVSSNPAKRMAGQVYGRWITVIGAGHMAPVARRWKGQFSEVAKAWAQFEFLPEADHNTMAGLLNPAEVLSRNMVIFLRSPSDHPRNRLRSDLTRKGFMLEGLNTDFFDARGDTPMAHMWTTLHFGDYTAFYLAMAYEVDPSTVAAIEGLKAEMK